MLVSIATVALIFGYCRMFFVFSRRLNQQRTSLSMAPNLRMQQLGYMLYAEVEWKLRRNLVLI
jgi:hypothetical protein